MQDVSVVGLGKLGLCFAIVLQHNGFNVIGYDINQTVIESIKQKKAPYLEDDLQELIDQSPPLTIGNSVQELVDKTNFTVLVLPTPSKKNGEFSTEYLEAALKECSQALQKKSGHHVFSIISTVSPNSVDTVLIPLIEKISGKKCKKDFSICYNPSFIALGKIASGAKL